MTASRALDCRLLILLIPVLAGCGGFSPCGGDSYGSSNPAYAGAYSGTYTNNRSFGTSGSAHNLTLQLAITSVGVVSGTVTEPSSGRTASAGGQVEDWFDSCSTNHTVLNVTFTFAGETERALNGSRAIGLTQPWPFTTGYYTGAILIGQGRLVLTKQ